MTMTKPTVLDQLTEALNELQRDAVIEAWSCGRKANGEWMINLQPNKAWSKCHGLMIINYLNKAAVQK
jgi:hypothetical protein